MNKQRRSPRVQNKPRNLIDTEVPVSHIYDRTAKGRVVGHDVNDKGQYGSGLVVVQWDSRPEPQFCIQDELVDLRPPRRKRQERD